MEFTPLALIGFMGGGKTTVGRAVANELDASFSDLDDQIENISGMRIPQIIEQLGEDGLRHLESLALSNLASFGGVAATSGSCVMIPRNREILEENFTVFFLDTSFRELYPRILGTGRPLLKSLSEVELGKLFELRRPLYQGVADYTIDASKPVDELVSEILDKVIIF